MIEALLPFFGDFAALLAIFGTLTQDSRPLTSQETSQGGEPMAPAWTHRKAA